MSPFCLHPWRLCGVLGTVLFFTVDPSFDSTTDADGAGGGNVTLSLSEEALASLIASELPGLPGFGETPQVETTVGANGIIRVDIGIGGLGVGLRSSITVNPNIVMAGEVDVVDARLSTAVRKTRDLMARPIARRLIRVWGITYRVTHIRTTERGAARIEI